MGEKEQSKNTANVRTRDNKVHGEHDIDTIKEKLQGFTDSKCLDAEERF